MENIIELKDPLFVEKYDGNVYYFKSKELAISFMIWDNDIVIPLNFYFYSSQKY